jgi:hypothetical protein
MNFVGYMYFGQAVLNLDIMSFPRLVYRGLPAMGLYIVEVKKGELGDEEEGEVVNEFLCEQAEWVYSLVDRYLVISTPIT